MANITVGPVVGLVTDTTARVLIETDSDAEVTVDVAVKSPDGFQSEPRAGQTMKLRSNRPTVFSLDQLDAGLTYAVGFSVENRAERMATVRPIQGGQLRTAVVSCCNVMHQVPPKAWDAIGKRVVGGRLDAILHVGDQVYGDELCGSWIEKLNRMDAADWPKTFAAIRDDYRNLYRTSWNKPFIQRCLANTSNLMIWDEHDVGEDWGDKPTFADSSCPEHQIARQAWQVYREYQRQLWDPQALSQGYPGLDESGSTEIIHQRWNDIGVLMLDVRGGRGFRQFDREAQEPLQHDAPYLSSGQWEVIERALIRDGYFEAVRTLLVVTPTPVAFIGYRQIKDHLLRAPWGISEKIRNLYDDIRGTWCYGQYRFEQARLLNTLHQWQKRKQEREVMIIGGGVHVGGEWEVHDSETKDLAFRQLVASPVHCAPQNWMKFRFLAGHLKHPSMDRERVTDPPRFHWKAKEVYRQQNVAFISVDSTRPPGRAIDSRIELFA